MPLNPKESERRIEAKSMELANILNDIFLDNDIHILERTIRYMAQNTRDTLKSSILIAEQKAKEL